MDGSDPKSIAEVIASLKDSAELGKQLDLAQIWRQWGAIAGPMLLAHGRPLGIREETLFVEVEGAVWMHRYSYHKWEILHRINGVLERMVVSDLYFVLDHEDETGTPQDTV